MLKGYSVILTTSFYDIIQNINGKKKVNEQTWNFMEGYHCQNKQTNKQTNKKTDNKGLKKKQRSQKTNKGLKK